jgi:hypothetical protein
LANLASLRACFLSRRASFFASRLASLLSSFSCLSCVPKRASAKSTSSKKATITKKKKDSQGRRCIVFLLLLLLLKKKKEGGKEEDAMALGELLGRSR